MSRAGATPRVSIVIIARNEAARIRACLDSVTWADEIVVVDDASQDGTAEICRAAGARVFQRRLTKFGEQKQFGVDQATGEWIFSLDADERVPSGLGHELLNAMRTDRYDGIAVYRENKFLDRAFRYRGRFEPPLVRGFRRGRGRFTDSHVDEVIVVPGPIALMTTALLHEDAYPTLAVYFEKLNRYTSLTAADLNAKGVVLRPRNYLWYFGVKPLLVFLHRYVTKRGYREGMYGFLWYALRAAAYFVSYAKLWELQRRGKD